MRKVWTVVVDGAEHAVDVFWDVTMSGSGQITVDGVVVAKWGWGWKWPGLSRDFAIGSRPACVTQSLLDFQLYMDGQPVGGARTIPHPYGWARIVVVVALGIAVSMAGLAVLLSIRAWLLDGGAG